MTTPPPDTKVQSETLEEIADRIIQRHTNYQGRWITAPTIVRMFVLSALRNERERAIRIINDHQALDKCEDNCWTTIKAAIREGR